MADGEKRLCVVCLCLWYQKWEYLTLADAPVSELLQSFDMRIPVFTLTEVVCLFCTEQSSYS